MIDVRIPDPGQTAVPSAAEIEADALARAETARITQLVADGEVQLATLRRQVRDGRSEEAIATADAAIGSLPSNSLTQKLIADLKKEKATALLDRAQAALKRGDLAAARTAVMMHGQIAPSSSRSQGIERQITRAESVPVVAAVDPVFAADRAASAQLIAKGRAQYVAGDLDGAQETFRAIEAQEPDNTVAKGFLLRIAEEKTETGALNREKTRAQLLEEVAKSWQRPGIFQERAREASVVEAAGPLLQKLNQIVVPEFVFSRAPLADLTNNLGEISAAYDTTGTSPKGVNFVLQDASGKNPLVSISLRGLSLKRVLDLVTQQVGYQYEVQADAVIIRPGGETTTLETQFFAVTRATVLRMTGMSSSAVRPRPVILINLPVPAAARPTVSGGEAASMRAFLQQAGVSFRSRAARWPTTVPRSSSRRRPRNIERIRNILARYNDVRQVEIEAKFMEVQEGALEELGVSWNLSRRGVAQVNPTTGAPILDSERPADLRSAGNLHQRRCHPFADRRVPEHVERQRSRDQGPGDHQFGYRPQADLRSVARAGLRPSVPGAVQLAATANALANIVGFVGEFDVSAAVRALSQKQGTDLLSSPKLTVLSGNPANITVAQDSVTRKATVKSRARSAPAPSPAARRASPSPRARRRNLRCATSASK
jgi:general secretion pathway protein D